MRYRVRDSSESSNDEVLDEEKRSNDKSNDEESDDSSESSNEMNNEGDYPKDESGDTSESSESSVNSNDKEQKEKALNGNTSGEKKEAEPNLEDAQNNIASRKRNSRSWVPRLQRNQFVKNKKRMMTFALVAMGKSQVIVPCPPMRCKRKKYKVFGIFSSNEESLS